MSAIVRADAAVIGGGLVGLCSALAIAERGGKVTIAGVPRAGEASRAAGGLLAPTIEAVEGPALQFGILARDRYPSFLAWLEERSGVRVWLNREGILELALDERDRSRLQRPAAHAAVWMEPREVARLEPGIATGLGALLHPSDGAVDNVRLLQALVITARRHERISVVEEGAIGLGLERGSATVRLAGGGSIVARRIVLAAGAWAPQLQGLPRPLPVSPLRGQMLAYDLRLVAHAVYGAHGYLVPRDRAETISGSTSEEAGFEVATTQEGVRTIRDRAERIAPILAGREPTRAWSGLRPVTPDFLPILGADPDAPELVYACGHSRNGVLMAPLTGDCIAALVSGSAPPADLGIFDVARFRDRTLTFER